MGQHSTPEHYHAMSHRTAMVLGEGTMKRLAGTRILLVGLGGVGSWCAEGLIRSGVMHLTIVDSDIICATNINRQIQATTATIGKSKAEELGKRLREINPSAQIDIRHGLFDASTWETFSLDSYDYVIDAIDSIASKVLLIEKCVSLGVPVYSSMGAAAKTDPSQIRMGLLSETTVCPLARLIRKNLKKIPITTDIPCVYSVEPPQSRTGSPSAESFPDTCADDISMTETHPAGKRINGSLVHITAIFGFMLTAMVIRDIRGA